MAEIVERFKRFFGDRGGDKLPSNYGKGRTVVQLCRKAMESDQPILFDYYADWDKRDSERALAENELARNPLGISLRLLQRGQWEGAWAVIQLHFDQTQKKERVESARQHKGHPLCGMAILGQILGSHALVRHYAQLSSAGDVYWEHRDKELGYGGLAPTILEQYESSTEHDGWRQTVRNMLAAVGQNEPRYLEAFLAARWFGGAYSERFLDLAGVAGQAGRPFAEVLLEAVEAPGNATSPVTGTRFEAATGLLLSSTPGFEVRSARQTTDEQVDLVVRYERDRVTILPLAPGPGLVECKASRGPVAVSELRDFGAKCQFHRVSFGVLVARSGITGGGGAQFQEPTHAELVRRRLLVDGLTILVLDISHLRGKTRELRGLQEVLAADHDRLIFGPIAGGP